MFIKRKKNGGLSGCVATHIDDILHFGGDDEFDQIVMDKIRKRFVAGKLEEKTFKYVGLDVNQNEKGIILDQTKYLRNNCYTF